MVHLDPSKDYKGKWKLVKKGLNIGCCLSRAGDGLPACMTDRADSCTRFRHETVPGDVLILALYLFSLSPATTKQVIT